MLRNFVSVERKMTGFCTITVNVSDVSQNCGSLYHKNTIKVIVTMTLSTSHRVVLRSP